MHHVFFRVGILLIAAGCGLPDRKHLTLEVSYVPSCVMIGADNAVYYELWVTNNSPDTVMVNAVRITDSRSGEEQVSFQSGDVARRFRRIVSSVTEKGVWLSPGGSGVVYLELYSKEAERSVRHTVSFSVRKGVNLTEHVVESAPVKFMALKTLPLGNPLREGTWAAVYEPSWERGHRRAMYAVGGKWYVPGRYAIDFIRLNDRGLYAQGDQDSIRNWHGYGADVYAVADGVVASTSTGFSESPTLSGHPRYAPEEATGNYISLNIGENQFAFYEHLKPGSIVVKPGQKVLRGEKIASVGFTGQSTGPHLHFHIADADAALGAEGVPFVFEQFILLGHYKDFGDFGIKPWEAMQEQIVKQNRPAPNTVIRFSPL